MKRTNLFLDDQDREALGIIKGAHGLATDSSAARFAIREMARQIERQAKRVERHKPRVENQPASEAGTMTEEGRA